MRDKPGSSPVKTGGRVQAIEWYTVFIVASWLWRTERIQARRRQPVGDGKGDGRSLAAPLRPPPRREKWIEHRGHRFSPTGPVCRGFVDRHGADCAGGDVGCSWLGGALKVAVVARPLCCF